VDNPATRVCPAVGERANHLATAAKSISGDDPIITKNPAEPRHK